MTAELVSSAEYDVQPLAPFDLAAHIAKQVLNDPTYSIDYIHPDLVTPTAEELSLDERLDVSTPVLYARGNDIGRLTLKVNVTSAPLAKVIEFPTQTENA